MNSWKIVTLGNIAKYSNKRICSDNLNSNNYISTENMLQNKGGITETSVIPKGNVIQFRKGQTLISNIRPYFKKIWLAEYDGGCSADVLVLDSCDEIDNEYLYYFLSQDSFFDYVMAGSKGTKMPRGDKDQIMKFNIMYPSIIEQKSIVNILSNLDNLVDFNDKIIINLEKIAHNIYKSWFVDFEPFIENEKEFSELGEIPKGWQVRSLEEICNIKYGKNLPTSSLKKEGYHVFGGNGIIGFHNDFLYKEPQVLVSCRGAASGKVLTSYPYSFVTNNSLVLEAKNDMNYEFLKYHFLNNTFEKYATGSAQPQITIENIKFIKMIVPPKLILEEYSNIIKYIEKLIFQNINKNKKIVEIRDLLLPKLMLGEIRVPIKENQ